MPGIRPGNPAKISHNYTKLCECWDKDQPIKHYPVFGFLIMRKVGDLFEFVSTDTGDCIIHCMMYASSDGVKWMPQHIALGSILHQATRSTLLVEPLQKAGHKQLDRQIFKLDSSLARDTVCS